MGGAEQTASSNKIYVGVIPMSDEVLFPGVTLSLHVIEKKQDEMLKKIALEDLPIAVSLIVRKKNNEFAFNKICGAGHFKIADRCPDGHPDVHIYGKLRIKLCKIIQFEPFYLMEAEPLRTETVFERKMSRSFEEFQALIKGWVFLNPEIEDHWTLTFDKMKQFGELTDYFVFHFLKSPREKQEYLNSNNPFQRAEKLIQFLERDLIRLGNKTLKTRKFELLH